MTARTIMIFPEFENMQYIDELRRKYDPLAFKVRPHITLVFPFESNFNKTEILKILDKRLRHIMPFRIYVQGLSVTDRWLVLNIADGTDILAEIHKVLYDNEFSVYKPVWLNNYAPHITVGQFNAVEQAKIAYDKERNFDKSFSFLADKISVEIIGNDEESIIETEYLLGSKY